MRKKRLRQRSSERGAVAVLVGILALVLFGLAAFAVDLGNAVARKAGVQGQADLSALAAAAELPGTTMDASDPAVAAVATYLIENEQQDDDGTPLPVLASLQSQLMNPLSPLDGRVEFITRNRLRVTTPAAHVDFGLASILGFSSTDVQASAEVMIGSPSKALPFYVGESCSYLQQTIINAPNGHEDPRVPDLDPAGDSTFTINLNSITPDSTPVDTAVTGAVLSAQGGNSMDGVDLVGFTTEDRGAASPSLHEQVSVTGSGSSVTMDIPQAVYEEEAVWYVRVHKGGKWSEDAVPFKVGEPPLYCDGSESGNFGALSLSRNDATPGSWVEMNTIKGIMHSVSTYPGSAPTPCEGYPDSVTAHSTTDTIPSPKPVNCVVTEPGLVSQATTGFLLGAKDDTNTYFPGLLVSDKSTCDPAGGDDPREVTISGKGLVKFNNDILTCFFKDSTTTVAEVSAKENAKEDAISSDIFKSPRFFWMPVLSDDPSGGRSGSYPILEFRGAFLTGQPPEASQIDAKQTETEAAENGLVVDNNGVASVQVVMINEASLPDTADIPGDIIEYIGSGTKIARLVD